MQIQKRLKGSQRVTFAAMTVALTVVVLYTASIMPIGRIALYFIASVLITMLVEEHELVLAIAAFIASSLITFWFVENKIIVAPYVMLLGHYAIFRQFAAYRVRDIWLQRFVKLLYANVFMALGVFAVTEVLALADLQPMLAIMPFWAWAILAQVVFMIYDFLFTLTIRFYHTVLRPLLISQRH